MGTKKYKYDEKAGAYQPIKGNLGKTLRNLGAFLIVTAFFGIISGLIFSQNIKSPEQNSLVAELQEMKIQYELLNKKIKHSQEVLSQIEDRDNNIYRSYFELTPISGDVRKAGFGGVNRYAKFSEWEYGDLVTDVTKGIDILNKRMVIQSKSLDEIVVSAKEKDKMLSHLPAIQPIANKNLNRVSSGFGVRIHPILKVGKLHKGIDFSAPSGSPVYATGDGKVKLSGRMGGYGNAVIVNHGYGYETLYAHMSRAKVRKGQSVKRGDIIGYVGSTGLSTGSHLHYEVHKDGQAVDPAPFFYQDLSPDQFRDMLEKSQQMSVSLD